MPFNLAIFGANRASQIIEQNPAITHWIIAGHSLGGAMAVNYIDDHPGEVSGLLLLAAYSAARNDISGQILIGASLYGSRDGLVDIQTIYDTQPLLTTSICHS
jgi:pimeloyl-ACP methyl ester carboxylesterase